MIKKIMLGSTIAASLLLVGCGSSDNTDTTTLSSTTGYVVDSAVANMDYDCVADNEMDKVTGADGAFTCQNMSQVRFRIGELVLGEISTLPQDHYVFPQDIVGVTRSNIQDPSVTALAQLLQSLDSDGNLENGIQIPDEVGQLLEETNFNASEVTSYMDEASIDPTHIRTEAEAQAHLQDTMHALNADNSNGNAGNTEHTGSMFDVNGYPVYALTPEVEETIAYMGNEERLAHDVYLNLYNYHLNNGVEIKQLVNIATGAEVQHIEIVQSLVHKYNLDASTIIENPVADSSVTPDNMPSGQYGIPVIQNLYDTLYAKGQASQQDALEVGCMVEVTDVNDLDADIALAEAAGAEDVVAAFNVLRDGSYNHYWAFDKGLKNMGVTDGCCSLGTDYCRPEYPQNENGGNGQENGQGNRQGNH